MYQVIDSQTGYAVGQPCHTLKLASDRCTRLDNQYGAYRYFHKQIEADLYHVRDNKKGEFIGSHGRAYSYQTKGDAQASANRCSSIDACESLLPMQNRFTVEVAT